MFLRNLLRALLLATLAVCALTTGGCAGLRVPRIDPSGERIFIWPRDQVPPAVPASANLQAPPVFTDPVFPQPALPANASIPPNTIAGQPISGLIPPLPQDRLTITPDRVLAPVGSEVILKAGLCTRENFLLTDSKIEWLIARDSAGEFVELGGRGLLQNPLLPWNKPKKIDNQFATGYTAKVPLQITRGTADVTDDVQVQPGEAWASITSPVEGTSRITAVAPEIETWANRRATATIYWVDVLWTFPAPAITASGAQVLTTTVRRQTDGTPIEGWLVRYEVADGTTNEPVEVPTDAQGRASIDVTPTGSAGAVTRINTQIVRPERYAGSNAPRLVIANGTSTISWTDGSSDYLPVPDDLGPSPDLGGGTSQPSQPTPAARRGPVLELEVYTNDTKVEVGKQARFEVLIRNTGDTPATGIVLNDRYDQGFSFPGDPQRFLEIKKSINDISAGAEYSEFLTFNVQQAGQLCQNFTVTYSQGQPAKKQACIQAVQPQRQPQSQLELLKTGPRQRKAGEMALFSFSVKNVGETPLTNIEIVDTFDRELQPQLPAGAEIRNGSLFWNIPRLEVGQTRTFDVNCQCLAASKNACSTVSVSADTGTLDGTISQSEQWCLEISPNLGDVVPPNAPPPVGNVLPGVEPPAAGANDPNAAGTLRMELSLLANPVRVGTRATFQVVIRNRATTAEQQVQLSMTFPAELRPDVAAIRNDASVQPRFANGQLVFDPIATMAGNAQHMFTIPCIANQQGIRNVTAELSSQNTTQTIQQTQQIEIIGG